MGSVDGEVPKRNNRRLRSEVISLARVRELVRGSGWLSTLFVSLLLGFCALVIFMLVEMRRDALGRAETNGSNLVAVASQDIARNVELYGLSLRAVANSLQIPALDQLDPSTRQAVLFDQAAPGAYLGDILVLDEHGDVIEDSGNHSGRRENFSNRSYFRSQRSRSNGDLFISAPFHAQSKTAGDLVIALSLRLSHPDGSFAGVVVGTIRLDYFRNLFGHVALGTHGAVTLFNTDGVVLMRSPYVESQIGQDLSATSNVSHLLHADSGHFSGVATLDGVKRVYSFAHIGDLPLVLSVAFSESDIYADWRFLAGLIGLVLLVLCAATGALGVLLKCELRRRARTEARIRISEAKYRLLADYATDVIVRLGPDMMRRYVSPGSLSVLGYTAVELVGRAMQATTHPDDWRRVMTLARNAQQGQVNAEMVYRFRHKAGHYIWVEAHYSYVGEDGGFIVVLRDISTRKQTESRLEAANAELMRLAATDGLTGLANRRRFDEAIGQEWARAARDELPLSLVLLDVDQFKLFNDRYGHQEGDACLRAVSQAISACVERPADIVARYGGEELVVLLPGTDEAGAAALAETMRLAIASLEITHESNVAHGLVVTASLGLATIVPSTRADEMHRRATDPAHLIAAADRALYEAKRRGRNCVVATTELRAFRSLRVFDGEAARPAIQLVA